MCPDVNQPPARPPTTVVWNAWDPFSQFLVGRGHWHGQDCQAKWGWLLQLLLLSDNLATFSKDTSKKTLKSRPYYVLICCSNVFTWSRGNTDLQNWVASCLKRIFSLLPNRVFRKDRGTSLKSTRVSYLQTADASEEMGVFSFNIWDANTSETSPKHLVSPCDLLCQAYSIWSFYSSAKHCRLQRHFSIGWLESEIFCIHTAWVMAPERVCWSISQSLSLKGDWVQQLSLGSPSQFLLNVFKWLLNRSHLVFY